MKIILNIQDLADDIFAKSHYGTSIIDNVERRYDVEAGASKKDDIARCLSEANVAVVAMSSRFMTCSYSEIAANFLDLPESFIYKFKASERRFANRTQAYADIMHSLLVNLTLYKYYNNVSQGDLAAKHDGLAKGDIAMLERLLYEKTPPIPPAEV